jgi:hypothetical protein
MVALSEDARLDRLERHAQEGSTRDDQLIGYCSDLLQALKLIHEELHGKNP